MEAHEQAVLEHVLQRIRTTVRSRGMAGAELVRRSGVARGTVYAALRESETQNLTLDQVWAIARGLDLDPAELMPLDGPRDNPAFSRAEVELVEAVQSADHTRIRRALTELLPPAVYDRVVGGVVMPADERLQLAEALVMVGKHLQAEGMLAAKMGQTDDPAE